MIVLNSNKELIRVDSWEDIQSRPGFSSDLNPTQHELASIIGRYAFSDRIRCGLSNCHTPHAKGYIVTTKDGQVTNIGKDCGKTYFGVDFETMSRKFDQDITDKENRERLWSFAFRIEEVKSQVASLRESEYGADWVYRTSRALVESGKGVPATAVRRIAQMLKTGQSTLISEREATEREIEQLEIASGKRVQRPHYIEVPIAQMEGLDALYAENDLRQLLVLDIQEQLKLFDTVSIDDLTSEALKRWNKWIGGSLSGILCARHSMTRRSMYAKQEDDEGGCGRGGEVADDPEGTH